MGGTLSQPVLAGDVRPTDGRFHLPGMRGDFDLVPNVNHVTFIATKSVADGDTPELEIEAQSTVPDASGNDHNVHLRLHGPIREAQIDLSTDDGLDRSQTAMLMLTGRTSMDTSQRFGTENPTVGANITPAPTSPGRSRATRWRTSWNRTSTTRSSGVTGFNLRLTVGPDGFEGRILKRISRYFELPGRYAAGLPEPEPADRAARRLASRLHQPGRRPSAHQLSSQQGVPNPPHERESRAQVGFRDKKVSPLL